MDIFKKCDDYKVVEEFKAQGLYPYSKELSSRTGTVVDMEGHKVIMLGSNNYLGLTNSDLMIEHSLDVVKKYGTGCSGSRFLNGTLNLHTKFEREMAEFMGFDDCITFGTGFQANLGVIAGLCDRGDIIFCDKKNHASIYDGCKLSYATMVRFEHNDMKGLEELLKNAPKEKGKLIVTDGIFSMEGDICDLPSIVKLAKKYGARIMIDDAHAFGVLGKNGRGTADHFGLTKDVDIVMGTFSKSLASMGGWAVAKKSVINWLRHKSRPYIFCASLTPACIGAATKALEIIRGSDERQKNLLEISKYMRAGLKKRGIKFHDTSGITPIIPILTYTAELTLYACKVLFDNGVYVNPVLPPATPEGECLIRTSYMATHTKEQIDTALDIIKKVFDEIGIK